MSGLLENARTSAERAWALAPELGIDAVFGFGYLRGDELALAVLHIRVCRSCPFVN